MATVVHAVSWTPPTSTEIGTVLKSGLAAGISWPIAERVTGVTDPVLAALTALVVVQVSVRASVFNALQRSAAVVLGVVAALALGDALDLDALSVALLVTVSLAVAELVLRLPAAAARQVPVSGLLVLSTAAIDPGSYGGLRALDTVVGAVVGVIVSLVLPASRLVDSRQTLDRLAGSLGDVLEAMGTGLAEPWTPEQTREWRRTARTARERLVDQAVEAVGNGRESARWNVRDRRHTEELGRYEEVLPRLERTAIGVSVISRGLDDYAHLKAHLESAHLEAANLETANLDCQRKVRPRSRPRRAPPCRPWAPCWWRWAAPCGRSSATSSGPRIGSTSTGRSPRSAPSASAACRAHPDGRDWPWSTTRRRAGPPKRQRSRASG